MSKQFEHLQEATLRRLQALIPHDCPLVVRRLAPGTATGGFVVSIHDDSTAGHSGRFQVVAAWIEGYVTAWRRLGLDAQPTILCACGTVMVCPDLGCDRHKAQR